MEKYFIVTATALTIEEAINELEKKVNKEITANRNILKGGVSICVHGSSIIASQAMIEIEI